MNTTIHVNDDLRVEVWPDGRGDEPLAQIVSASMQCDDPDIGAVVIWPEEIQDVIDALGQAGKMLNGKRG